MLKLSSGGRRILSPHAQRLLVGAILKLRDDPRRWPADVEPSSEYGIVISGCGRMLGQLYPNLRNIRDLGFAGEIEIWRLPGEFTCEQAEVLRPLASLREDASSPFNGLSGKHEVHGFKAWALAKSRFRKTLLLDVNCFPLRPLDVVFTSPHGCIQWQDGPWKGCHARVTKLRKALGTVTHDCEFESGQLFVDRSSREMRRALSFAAALNTIGRPLYRCVHGDKETYALALDLLGVPFTIAPLPAVHPPQPEFACEGLLQPWLDGSSLFYHPMLAKNRWFEYKPEWAALRDECETVIGRLVRNEVVAGRVGS